MFINISNDKIPNLGNMSCCDRHQREEKCLLQPPWPIIQKYYYIFCLKYFEWKSIQSNFNYPNHHYNKFTEKCARCQI